MKLRTRIVLVLAVFLVAWAARTAGSIPTVLPVGLTLWLVIRAAPHCWRDVKMVAEFLSTFRFRRGAHARHNTTL